MAPCSPCSSAAWCSGVVDDADALRGRGRQRQDRPREAEAAYQQAIAIWEKAGGKDNPVLIIPLSRYAELLAQLERSEEADKIRARVETLQAQRRQGGQGRP